MAGPPRETAKEEKYGRLGVLDQAMVNGVERKLEAVGNTQLVENVVQMVLDGLLGDKQLLADLFVAETLRHQLHDLFFAVGKQRLLAARAGFR